MKSLRGQRFEETSKLRALNFYDTGVISVMAKQLSQSDKPVYEVFELTIEGRTRKEIIDLLNLTQYQLSNIKNSKAFIELLEEYQDDTNRQCDLFQQHQLRHYNSLMEKVNQRLMELANSDNEKIALEANKFIANRQQKLYEDSVNVRLAILEAQLSALNRK